MHAGWLIRGVIALLVLTAVAITVLVLLLSPAPAPPPLPPAPVITPDSAAAEVEPGSSDDQSHGAPHQQRRTTTSGPRPTSPSGRNPSPRAATAPPPDSIIDLRRIQAGRAAPESNDPPASAPAPHAAGLDRSEVARRRGIEQFGGTRRTEDAVEAGLAWLAAHQFPDGTWDRFRFAELDPPGDRSTGPAIHRTTTSVRAGLTGLCLLAFLGAGYTDREGPYQQVVRAAVDSLLVIQQDHGGFGPPPEDGMAGYNDSLATLALAEYAALTRDPRVRAPLERAVRRLVGNQQALGGWDYQAFPTIGRNDTSITAWMVQALHAAVAAGVEVPPETLVKAAMHFTRATEADGDVRYSDQGTGFEIGPGGMPQHRYGPGMLAAGLMTTQMLGWRLDATTVRRQTARVLAQPPSTTLFHGRDPSDLHSEYYWYYATLAMFQRGGDEWQQWNAKLRDTVLTLQVREKGRDGRKSAAYGSWDPYGKSWGKWGKMGSRVYTTAILVLTLEVYYRHTPAYLAEDTLLSLGAWRGYLAEAPAAERREAVRCLAQLRLEIGEPVLVELLRDAERDVALAAAEALVGLDSPAGLPVLARVVSELPPWGRHTTERALARAKELAALPAVDGGIRFVDPQRRMVTAALPRSHVGQTLLVERGGREVVRLRVVRRFSGRDVVVAEWPAASIAAPVVGDAVRTAPPDF